MFGPLGDMRVEIFGYAFGGMGRDKVKPFFNTFYVTPGDE